MSKLLINCLPGDVHVVATVWGLAQFGGEAVIWYPGDLPDYQSSSVELTDGVLTVAITSRDCETVTFDDIGAYWDRRCPKPVAPDWISKADVSTVEDQCSRHVQGLRFLSAQGVFTLNPHEAEAKASKKLLQLKLAPQCGFRVPDTLVTNDPERVLGFWRRKDGRVVAKAHAGTAWRSEGGVHAFVTAMLPEPTEELYDSIRSAPYIYQEAILNRRCDVRLIYMDGRIFSCAIYPATPDTVDIRRDISRRIAPHELVETPEDIDTAVRRYCDMFGLVYGAFDFIVDEAGTWWFLECNSAGQFLWLEHYVPELRLLDSFCKMFLRHMEVPFDESRVVTTAEFGASGVWKEEQARWPGPHKPGIIIGGYLPEDAEDLELLASLKRDIPPTI
jgi:glutathione synthase/RimK-type ligase-like ATP-grasp enzyme